MPPGLFGVCGEMGWFSWIWNRRAPEPEGPQGFLGRLRRDQRGATLAMMAASVIPMIGVVGGAVDISRAYLVKVRLQQACDAGVLAARRAMTGSSITDDTNAKTQATNFFKINLKNGAYGATVTPITVTNVVDAANKPTGTVAGAASATVPTTLMKIFGKKTIAMNASCEATLQVANNDVMFVLDVTGSMNCAATDTSSTCSNNGGAEKSTSKIKALRVAVVDFYDTLKAATTSTAQLRIGFVPYSSNVNVGGLLPAGYIADSAPYQSRERIVSSYTTTNANGGWNSVTNNTGSWVTHSTTTNVTESSCDDPANTTTYGSTTTSEGTVTDANGTITNTSVSTRSATDTEYTDSWVRTSQWWVSPAKGTCTISKRTVQRTETKTDVETKTPNYAWNYKQISYDTSQFKLGNAVTTYTANGYAARTSTWAGCLEERDTVSNATFSSIPNNAYDLQIDLIPNNNVATQWKPWWPELVYDRNTTADVNNTSYNYSQPGGDSAVCPKAAQKITTTDHDAVYNYVNAADFKARGGTYHDFGLLWGARLLSPSGIFSSENTSAPNGHPINRSIVFMTDGDMAPQPSIYGLYGYEEIDRRISGSATTPSSSDLKSRHNSRFSAICGAIKDMNITLYVVAYAQSMTTELENCATPGKAFYAADDDELKEAFQKIAKQIAQLRLSK